MGKLKINLKLGEYQIELEGEENSVKEVFNDIRENGLGRAAVSPPIMKSERTVELIEELPIDSYYNDTLEEIDDCEELYTPKLDFVKLHLKDILIKGLTNSEYEMALITGVSLLSQSKITFTSVEILNMYKELKIYNNNRSKNIKRNLNKLITKSLIRSYNDEEYVPSDEGIELCEKIMTRTSSEIKVKTNVSKKTTKKSEKKNKKVNKYELIKFDLNSEKRRELQQLYNSPEVSSNKDRILLAMHLFKDIVPDGLYSYNHVFSIFKTVGEKIPKNLNQIIINLKNDSYLFKNGIMYELSHVGEDYIQDNILGES